MLLGDYEAGLAIARKAGETEELAKVFAGYYGEEAASWRECLDTEQEPTKTPESAAAADAWQQLAYYKQAHGRGHSHVWARAYGRERHYAEHEWEAEQPAYEAVVEAARKVGKNREYQRQAVGQEAALARLSHGPEYAAAYARFIGEYEYDTADHYAAEVVKQLEAGKSALVAHECAASIATENYLPEFALLEAEVYEKGLLSGLSEHYARLYADYLASSLARSNTPGEIEFYTKEADKFIEERQRMDSLLANRKKDFKRPDN